MDGNFKIDIIDFNDYNRSRDWRSIVASITVRNIPDKTKEILRVQAAQCGISLEAYVRRILEETSVEKERDNGSLLELANEFFGPKNGVDLELPARGTKRPAVRFD